MFFANKYIHAPVWKELLRLNQIDSAEGPPPEVSDNQLIELTRCAVHPVAPTDRLILRIQRRPQPRSRLLTLQT